MKLKKVVSTVLFSCLFTNNTSLSLASNLPKDERYEVFENDYIEVDDVLENDEVDIKIKGDTIFNLATVPDNSYLSYAGYGANVSKSIKEYGTYRWSKESPIGNDFYPKIILSKHDIGLIEPNKTYTIQYKIKSSQNINSGFCIANSDAYLGRVQNTVVLKNLDNGKNNKEKIVKEVFTTNAPTSPEEILAIGFGLVSENENDTVFPQWVEISDLVILEGDWSKRIIPSYFENGKSAFEDNLITQDMIELNKEEFATLDKYKVEIKNSGKNIFDKDNISQNGWINTSTGEFNSLNSDNYISEFIRVSPNIDYSVSPIHKGQSFIFKYDAQYRYIGYLIGAEFTTDNNCHYIRFGYSISKSIKPGMLNEIQIEKSSTPTEFEEYTKKINTIYLDSPLLKGDTIERIHNKWYHIRRYGKVILDGTEQWMEISNKNEYYGYDKDYSLLFLSDNYMEKINMKSSTLNPNSIYSYSNRFKSLSRNEGWDVKYQGEYIHNECISIKNSKLPSLDLYGFKQWLSENPVTVIYELNAPIYEPIETDIITPLFEGTTYMSNNSTIPANMKVTVDRVANRAKESIELLSSNPTIDNISQARYWSNLMKESTLKDSFQSEISNITDIEDLTIEKKTASVNTDIYIKMKNTLSLSLDTNSIIFDEVDITEDTEKLKAVNLTVSSSLPYKINACLEDEIYNSNKSEILDKSVLNIKANEDITYQAFSDLISPIILLDDQEAGVEVAHEIDLRLASNDTYKSDIYKATIKFEVVQK